MGSPGLHRWDHSANHFLLSHRYPHDTVNRLSCNEAKNHYGGVVSLIPIVLDYMKEWVAHVEKPPQSKLYNVSGGSTVSERKALQEAPARAAISQTPPSVQLEAQTSVSNKANVHTQGVKHVQKKDLNDTENHSGKFKCPWKPPGRHAF